METTTAPSTARIALKYGLYIGLGIVIYSLILYITSLELNMWLGFIAFALLIAGLVITLKEFRQANSNAMTFGQGFGLGLQTSVVCGLLVSLFTIVYTFYIDPSSRERQIKYSIEKSEEMMRSFGASDDKIDEAIEQIREDANNTGPGKAFISSIVVYAIAGAIFSLILAAIMKRTKDVFAQ